MLNKGQHVTVLSQEQPVTGIVNLRKNPFTIGNEGGKEVGIIHSSSKKAAGYTPCS